MFTVNLVKELNSIQNKTYVCNDIKKLKQILITENEKDEELLKQLGVKTFENLGELKNLEFKLSKFDPNKIFHIEVIKNFCYKYRLFFSSISNFKGTISNQTLQSIRETFDKLGTKPYAFNVMVLAPAELFHDLGIEKDPVFFYKIDNEHYYMFHKEGNDFSIIRRIQGSIFRSPASIFFWLYLIVPFLFGSILCNFKYIKTVPNYDFFHPALMLGMLGCWVAFTAYFVWYDFTQKIYLTSKYRIEEGKKFASN